MTLLTVILMGIVTALVMAYDGDYSGLALIGKILIYIVIGGLFIWFLAATGWGGMILILVICFIIAAWNTIGE